MNTLPIVNRSIFPVLKQLATEYPIVTVTGPRQSGKTTLVQACFPSHTYTNLESPDIRMFAESDPRGFFTRFPSPLIIDEIQRVPSLLSYIQVISDQKRIKGAFVLTGSHQSELHQAITQSLAGRTALLRLLPLSIHELKQAKRDLSVDELLFRGLMPALHHDIKDPTTYYRSYFQTYIERDVRQLLHVRNMIQFERFMVLLAGRAGQLVNLSALSGEVGVSSTTLNEWLSVLEASHIVFRLSPYFGNIGKRLVKSPKIYFTEVGLASFLLGIESINHASRDPLRGQLFENLVVLEALKARLNAGKEGNLFFVRDDKGYEIDLLYKTGRRLIPIEIKSAMTFSPSFADRIRDFSDRVSNSGPGAVIYAGDPVPDFQSCPFLNFTDTATLFAATDK